MRLLVIALVFGICVAIPANHRLEERQRDNTYTITCLGSLCTDLPPTTIFWPTQFPVPGNPTTTPKPTSPKTTSTPTSKKTSSTSKYIPPPTSKYIPPPTSKPPPSTSKYTPPPEPPTKTIKSSQQPTKTNTGEVGPSSTRCPVPLYYQCGGLFGGKPWTGCTKCVSGAECILQNEFYYQCVAS